MNPFQIFRLKQKEWYERKFGQTPIQMGNPCARIVIIGQAPSRNGMANHKHFFDQTGKKLRHEWLKISDEDFYNPDLFYLTALGLVFPGKDKNGGDKRPDLAIPRKWLKQELSLLDPELFLILGRMASNFLFPHQDFEELIFNDQELLGKKAFVLPHPSPLNIKWLKDHPKFLGKRLPEVRQEVHKILDEGEFQKWLETFLKEDAAILDELAKH